MIENKSIESRIRISVIHIIVILLGILCFFRFGTWCVYPLAAAWRYLETE